MTITSYDPDPLYDGGWPEPALCPGSPPTPPDPACVLEKRKEYDRLRKDLDGYTSKKEADAYGDYKNETLLTSTTKAQYAAARAKRDAALSAAAAYDVAQKVKIVSDAVAAIAADCCP